MFIARYRDTKREVETLGTLEEALMWLQTRALPGLFEVVGPRSLNA
ncbi:MULTISPECIES: hypothetical protein [Cupriavidus]|uniref:Uncharacterized protein n=1 Tax=Cupriavidus basilensis TaxID=68895 RepID=A0A7M2HBS2_9BURK|nr:MULTISPECIES: hypothetical protein [Cupriavidus]MCY0853012.1 hypothetical protein [Cupriavidus sp. D39]QOT82233.1 hypothetical protein F7R26_039685 [Cupriavidus basilensis]